MKHENIELLGAKLKFKYLFKKHLECSSVTIFVCRPFGFLKPIPNSLTTLETDNTIIKCPDGDKGNQTRAYATTFSSLLMRTRRAVTTSWDASGRPRAVRAPTAWWIWATVESSLTAARRISLVSLDNGI